VPNDTARSGNGAHVFPAPGRNPAKGGRGGGSWDASGLHARGGGEKNIGVRLLEKTFKTSLCVGVYQKKKKQKQRKGKGIRKAINTTKEGSIKKTWGEVSRDREVGSRHDSSGKTRTEKR